MGKTECMPVVPYRRDYQPRDFKRCESMSTLCLGLCFDCYYVAIQFYVFRSLKTLSVISPCLSVITVCFSSIDILSCTREVEAGSLCLKPPVHFYLISSRYRKERYSKGHLLLLFSDAQPVSSSCRG